MHRLREIADKILDSGSIPRYSGNYVLWRPPLPSEILMDVAELDDTDIEILVRYVRDKYSQKRYQ